MSAPSDIIGRWIAAHDEPVLVFSTSRADWANAQRSGALRSCSLCGERLGEQSGAARQTCRAHTLPQRAGDIEWARIYDRMTRRDAEALRSGC